MACNLRCPECAIGSEMTTRKRGLMPLEDFEIVWDKVKDYAKLVYLHKWGEPTMNPNLKNYIKCVSKTAHSHVMTNGLLLDEKKINEYCSSGLGSLFFSIDGVTQETYEKYRVGGSCSIAWKNLELAHKIIKENNYPTDLFAQFIVFRHNEHQVEDFIAKCEGIGVRYHIRTAYIRFGSVDKPSNPKYVRKIFSSKCEHEEAISQCSHLTNVLTITADGSTILCSQDYDQQYNLGSLLDDSTTLETLWNHPYYVQIREEIKSKKNIPSICRDKCMIYPRSY